MLLQESQPRLDYVRMPVLDLNEAAHGDSLKVLLGLFENEICAWDGPALGYSGKGNWASCGKAHVVCCADGEVGEEEQIADRVGSELEVADWNAVFGGAPEWTQVYCLDVDGRAKLVKSSLGFGIEGFFVGWESNASFSVESR